METKIILLLAIALACTYTYIYANNQAKKTWKLLDKMNKSLENLEKEYPNWNVEDDTKMIKSLRINKKFQNYLIPYAKSYLDYHEHEGEVPKQKILFDIIKYCSDEILRDRSLKAIKRYNRYYKKLNKVSFKNQNL